MFRRRIASGIVLIATGCMCSPFAGNLLRSGPAKALQEESVLPPGSVPLDLKEGLWDVKAHTASQSPRKILDTPELRKSMSQFSREEQDKQIAMYQKNLDDQREMFAKGRDIQGKVCLTNHNWRTGEYFHLSNGTCTKKYTSTSERLTEHVTCTIGSGSGPGALESEDVVEINRIDSENFKATAKVTYMGEEPHVDMFSWTGTWIRSNCANPPTPQQIADANSPMQVRVERIGNKYRTVVTNHSKLTMTAYSIGIQHYGDAPKGTIEFWDARMERQTLNPPGGTVPVGQKGIVEQAGTIAAIYTDGSIFGREHAVGEIMGRRKALLEAFRQISDVLCDARQKGEDRTMTEKALEARKMKWLNGGTNGTMETAIARHMFDAYINNVNQSQKGRWVGYDELIQGLRNWAAQMAADPVKDPNGNLYIKPSDTVLPCSAVK